MRIERVTVEPLSINGNGKIRGSVHGSLVLEAQAKQPERGSLFAVVGE
jgi:hypothetical protein